MFFWGEVRCRVWGLGFGEYRIRNTEDGKLNMGDGRQEKECGRQETGDGRWNSIDQ